MKFSEFFKIHKTSEDGWFDPILSVDTPLFVDPFLIFAHEYGIFSGSHDELIRFFDCVFHLIARSKGNKESPNWIRSLGLLHFREVQELCLGYVSSGTKGSGSGTGLGNIFAEAMWEAIRAGLREIQHFEEICILRSGFGADRISDMTATILRHRLATYTLDICQKHGVPTREVRYSDGKFDITNSRWIPLITQLPINPYIRKPVILVPQRYLRDLPTINTGTFWDFCFDYENETLRQEFSNEVTRHVNKETIVEFAQNHPNLRKRYIEFTENNPQQPYNISEDPQMLQSWYDTTKKYSLEHPQPLVISSSQEFKTAITFFVEQFKHYIEQNGGWALLWNDNGRHRSERICQSLLLGLVMNYCQANNIDIAKESDIGRGPVDFKLSQGYGYRALLELKLASSSRFRDGFESQLPCYLDAEKTKLGFFIVIMFSDSDAEKAKDISSLVEQATSPLGYDVRAIIIDARKPISASKLHSESTTTRKEK